MSDWVASTNDTVGSYAEQWTDLIGPIRWFRAWNEPPGEHVYLFVVEDHAAAAAFDGLYGDESEWRPAKDWPRWEHFAALWSNDLVAVAAVAQNEWQGQQQWQGEDDWQGEWQGQEQWQANDQGGWQEAAPAEWQEQVAPVRAASRLADPTVASAADPQYAPGGAFAWPVTISVNDVQPVRSWIIQRVDLNDGENAVTFWEAFPVAANEAVASEQDIYQSGRSRLASGTFQVTGVMQHHQFGGEDPPDMAAGGSEYADHEQIATDAQPAFWTSDDGTPHNVIVQWRNAAGAGSLVRFETVPESNEPVFKEHHTQLRFG